MKQAKVLKLAFLLLLAVLIVTGCNKRLVGYGAWSKKIDSEEASRLMLNFAAHEKRVHHLELEDSRLIYDDMIKKWYMEFSSQRLLTVVEARLLLVELVEEFLRRVNNHTLLSFELATFPFTPNNLEVKINFESFFGHYVDPLYIGQIYLKCGCSYFYAFDRKDPEIDWNHDRWEPYFKSRELALLKKEADLPTIDLHGENPPARPSSLIYDRYFSPSF